MKPRMFILPALFTVLFAAATLAMKHSGPVFDGIFDDLANPVYDRIPFVRMVWQHFVLVAVSSGAAIVIGLSLGMFVTRRVGRDFLPVVQNLVSVGQTFPPVAVLAMAVPAVGFGAAPTIIALFLYGLLPIVGNTISGIESVEDTLLDAAKGMGMRPMQVLFKVELPLALTVIMGGVRTSVIINIGTATIGATIGAGGLGAPIVAGLVNQNSAYVLQGAILAGLFAITADSVMASVERGLRRGAVQ